jgi:hypothetical protein
MTRHKTLQCVHEPFGDAYYFGPERLAERYEDDPEARKESGYAESTYRTIFDRIARENSEVRMVTFPPGSSFSYFSCRVSFPSPFDSQRANHCFSIRQSLIRQLSVVCVANRWPHHLTLLRGSIAQNSVSICSQRVACRFTVPITQCGQIAIEIMGCICTTADGHRV